MRVAYSWSPRAMRVWWTCFYFKGTFVTALRSPKMKKTKACPLYLYLSYDLSRWDAYCAYCIRKYVRGQILDFPVPKVFLETKLLEYDIFQDFILKKRDCIQKCVSGQIIDFPVPKVFLETKILEYDVFRDFILKAGIIVYPIFCEGVFFQPCLKHIILYLHKGIFLLSRPLGKQCNHQS